MTNLKKKIDAAFNNVRFTERETLNSYPLEYAVIIQSGFLIGYADCWNKLKVKLDKILKEEK